MIEIKNISFSYEEGLNVLKNVSLNIQENEFVAVIGANGSGKSTLAKMLNALLVPNKGTVIVDNMDTSKEQNVWNVRESVGMVFQNPDNQIVATIVEEDVAFGLENLGVEPKDIRVRIDKALHDVDMFDKIKKAPHMLSGGQKQRVAIAGVLAMKPKYFVFDEATSMLDPQGRKEVLDSIAKLKAQGYAVIYITHFMQELIHFDRVVVLDKGEIIFDNDVKSLFTDSDVLDKLGFTLPPVIELSKKISESIDGFPICSTVDDFMEAICQYN